jgi:hypothetical protein
LRRLAQRRGDSPRNPGGGAQSIGQDYRNLRTSPRAVPAGGQNSGVDLARIAWLATVGVCLIVILILVLQGYLGYAGVTFAVAVAAAINLF